MSQLVVNRGIQIPHAEFEFRFDRSSGPGGQNVNKVNTKATLRWSVTTSPSLTAPVRERFVEKYRRRITNSGEVVIASQRYRDQSRNVDDCLGKLKAMLSEVAVAPRRRKATKPTRASRERRLKEKRKRSEVKQRRGPRKMED